MDLSVKLPQALGKGWELVIPPYWHDSWRFLTQKGRWEVELVAGPAGVRFYAYYRSSRGFRASYAGEGSSALEALVNLYLKVQAELTDFGAALVVSALPAADGFSQMLCQMEEKAEKSRRESAH
jgi:hypothetical protein